MKKIINISLTIAILTTLSLNYGCKKEVKIQAISTYKLANKDLIVTINDTGEIGSENESRVIVPFSSKIDNLIAEGTIVKTGAIVGHLSTTKEEKEITKGNLSNQESNYELKIADLNQKKDFFSLNKDLENSDLDIKIAELKVKQLTEGRDGLAIVKAQEELNTLNREIAIYEIEIPEREKLYKTGYIAYDELRQAKNKQAELVKQKKYAISNLTVLEKGPLNEEIEKEKVNLNNAKENFKKKKQELESLKKTSELAITTGKNKIIQSNERLKYYQHLVNSGSLTANGNGIVVYGKMPVGEDEVKVKAGDSVKEGVSVIRIFDLKKPVLRMLVNEVDIVKINTKQPVMFSLDAYPEKIYKGEILKIAPVAAKKLDRDKNNVVTFEVVVKILENSPLLKPGMTANIEIIVDSKKNTLSLPSQYVHQEKTQKFCYIRNGEKIVKQNVTTGISNELETEIRSGLKAGDEVVADFQEIES